jgi:hypothetical protein
MPQDVEARILQRLASATGRRPSRSPRGIGRRASVLKWLILAVLVLTATWVVRRNVLPVLRAAWERAHCFVDPPKGKR